MSDIFISYASADKGRIQPIVQTLEQKGWSVWWDRKIPPGKTFDEAIEDAIDAAKCVIVVWTKKSVASKWVRTEAGEGERLGVLIPILLDDVKIPLAFRLIEAAQLTDWDGVSGHPELDGLLEAITKFVGKPPITEPDRRATEKAGIERRETKRIKHERQETVKRTRKLEVATIIRYVSIAVLILGILVLAIGFSLDPDDIESKIPIILTAILGVIGFISTRKKRQEADKRTPNFKVAVVIWYVSIACLILGILILIFILDLQDHAARIPVILITILGITGLITTWKKR